MNIPMPNGMTRDNMLEILLCEEYGHLPPPPLAIEARELACDSAFCAGKAALRRLELICRTERGAFAFPVAYTQRQTSDPSPLLVHINFRPDVPDKYQPTEELVDGGYSVLSFCYTDVTSDDGDFTDGLAGLVYPGGVRGRHDCGKLGLWAWAAMRVIDYAVTLAQIDHTRITVAGHSRLGKTALLVGALDHRVWCAYSNDSGCAGAALFRDKQGETAAKIWEQFPYWFAPAFEAWVDREGEMPFDQHFLLCANAPHRVYVASAEEDLWADPEKEYLSCQLAAKHYRALGLPAALPTEMPRPGEPVDGGLIGYHIRRGKHYFSREDWRYLLGYLSQAQRRD